MSDTSAAHTRVEQEKDNISTLLPQDAFSVDIEQKAIDDAHLLNSTVRNYSWSGISVAVKDHKTKLPHTILQNIDGMVEAGEICALVSDISRVLFASLPMALLPTGCMSSPSMSSLVLDASDVLPVC